MRASRGFTIIELIVVIMITGIMGVAVMSRFSDRGLFESRGFQDETQSLLRYAQKAAIAQRRTVCVRFSANQAWLTVRNAGGDTACGAHAGPTAAAPAGETLLTGPTGVAPATATAGSATGYSAVPAAFYFDAAGRPSAGRTIAITGADPVTVEAETGYVH